MTWILKVNLSDTLHNILPLEQNIKTKAIPVSNL